MNTDCIAQLLRGMHPRNGRISPSNEIPAWGEMDRWRANTHSYVSLTRRNLSFFFRCCLFDGRLCFSVLSECWTKLIQLPWGSTCSLGEKCHCWCRIHPREDAPAPKFSITSSWTMYIGFWVPLTLVSMRPRANNCMCTKKSVSFFLSWGCVSVRVRLVHGWIRYFAWLMADLCEEFMIWKTAGCCLSRKRRPKKIVMPTRPPFAPLLGTSVSPGSSSLVWGWGSLVRTRSVHTTTKAQIRNIRMTFAMAKIEDEKSVQTISDKIVMQCPACRMTPSLPVVNYSLASYHMFHRTSCR